jgi:hypothetical protein
MPTDLLRYLLHHLLMLPKTYLPLPQFFQQIIFLCRNDRMKGREENRILRSMFIQEPWFEGPSARIDRSSDYPFQQTPVDATEQTLTD